MGKAGLTEMTTVTIWTNLIEDGRLLRRHSQQVPLQTGFRHCLRARVRARLWGVVISLDRPGLRSLPSGGRSPLLLLRKSQLAGLVLQQELPHTHLISACLEHGERRVIKAKTMPKEMTDSDKKDKSSRRII